MEKELEKLEQPQEECHGEASQESIRAEDNCGSILGKFKDTQSLEKAYENLQKEFTKKCQTLSDTQKKLESAYKETGTKEAFFASNPTAKRYIDDLENIISSDKQIMDSDNPYMSAWDKFRKDNFVSKDDLAKDQEFLDKYILTNEDLKKRVIEEYFANISLQNIPPIIAKQIGSKSLLAKQNKPNSFAEAGALAKSLLEK